jgi:hypothetical protein
MFTYYFGVNVYLDDFRTEYEKTKDEETKDALNEDLDDL